MLTMSTFLITFLEVLIKNPLYGGFFLPEICPLTMGHRRRVTSGTTRGYMVLVNGVEPLPIRLQGDCSTIGAKPACLAGQRGLEPR